MRDMNSYFPSTRLKAPDLQGLMRTAVISNITEQQFDDDKNPGRKKTVPELHFQGKQKTLLLNVTNRNELMKEFGPDGDLWIGKTIELHPTKTSIGGEIKDTILVGVPQGPAQAAPGPQEYAPPEGSTPPVDANPFQDQQNEGCNDQDDPDVPF